MPNITAFIGVCGSGKSYRAQHLVDKGFQQIDFKDALLDMASDLAGYDVREDYVWFKEHIVGVRRSINPILTGFYRHDNMKMVYNHPEALTGRRLLQRLGTEVMRKRDPDYWVKEFRKKAMKVMADGRDVVCADCRFGNEVRAIESSCDEPRFVFCDYRSPSYNAGHKHESEKMAQELLGLGLSDGDEIDFAQFAVVNPCKS